MAIRLTVVVMVLACGISLSAWLVSSDAVSGDQAGLEAAAAIAPAAANKEDEKPKYSYVGSKKCKKCHLTQHKSWAKTRMGQAFEILEPGKVAEAKEKFGLDPRMDYTENETCLGCHTTGYKKPDGYAPPDPDDKKAVRKASALKGVGCEACHGPASEYIKILEEIYKSQRKYKVEELYAVGMRKIDSSTCLECHNEKSPTINPDDPFDYEKRKAKGIHESKPLKLREE